MNITIEKEQEELSGPTSEILQSIENFRQKTRESMVLGEKRIILGTQIFEGVLREINPEIINDDMVLFVQKKAESILNEKFEEMQHVDRYVHFGVLECCLIMNGYVKRKRRELK